MIIASPFPRIGSQALAEAAMAAGFVEACPYETSAEAHQDAVMRWRQQHPKRWFALPSPMSVLLALVLVAL
jgi:hypothetical protein